MKKILSLVLILALVLGVCSFSLAAQPTISVAGGKLYGPYGTPVIPADNPYGGSDPTTPGSPLASWTDKDYEFYLASNETGRLTATVGAAEVCEIYVDGTLRSSGTGTATANINYSDLTGVIAAPAVQRGIWVVVKNATTDDFTGIWVKPVAKMEVTIIGGGSVILDETSQGSVPGLSAPITVTSKREFLVDFNDDYSIELVPSPGYVVSRLVLDGRDVTSQLVNNTFGGYVTDGSRYHTVQAFFSLSGTGYVIGNLPTTQQPGKTTTPVQQPEAKNNASTLAKVKVMDGKKTYTTLPKDESFTFTTIGGKNGKFLVVSLSGGSYGTVDMSKCEGTFSTINVMATVTSSTYTYDDMSTKSANRVEKLAKGDTVMIVGFYKGWVITEDGNYIPLSKVKLEVV